MISKHRPFGRVLILAAATTLWWSLGSRSAVSADDSTPIPDGSTPVATVAGVPTQPAPTALPTVAQEQFTPVATAVASPPVAPTPVPPTADTRIWLPTAVVPTAAPTAATARLNPPDASGPPSDYWPTPDQLRQDARLRWGTRVPDSVRRWAFLIVPAARRYHLDPNLIAAVMTMESNGDPLAWSGADARGLMQVLHGPWDPETNIDRGAHMLADLYDQFGDWTLVLAAYNAGPAAVEQYNGVPPFRETRDYVIVVRYLWDLYGHHRLSSLRRLQYRSSLRDLQRFKDQRKKVSRLARIAHVKVEALSPCTGDGCSLTGPIPTYDTLDPFWPLAGTPDPLQHVNP